jgi:hypothetical protein
MNGKILLVLLCVVCSQVKVSAAGKFHSDHAAPDTTIKGFGESNAAGLGAPNPSSSWFNIAASSMSFSGINLAVPNTEVNGTNGLDDTRVAGASSPYDYVTFLYGAYEAYNNVVNAQWKQDYKHYIQESFIDIGYDRTKLIIISPPYSVSSSNGSYLANLQQVRDYCEQIATELNIKFVDLFRELKATDLYWTPNHNSAYSRPIGNYRDNEFILNARGHRMLGDMVKYTMNPIPQQPGYARVKSFGAGSLVTASWRGANFVELFARETGKSAQNFGVVGSIIDYHNPPGSPDDTLDLKFQKIRALDGVKDIAIFFFGQNDSYSSTWKTEYKTYLQYFINNGYSPQNLVVMTIPRSPDLPTAFPGFYGNITQCNQATIQIAQEMGLRLLDADQILNALPNPMSYFQDAVHFNDLGHRVVADSLLALFRNATPLPVKFSLLNSQCVTGGVKVNWKTAMEINTSRFDVERSSDGRIWQVAGTVTASGMSSDERSYSFTDNTDGKFYRVKEYDLDGKATTTSVIRSFCSAKETTLSTYPNPVKDLLTVNVTVTQQNLSLVKIFNAAGTQVSTQQIKLLAGTNQFQVNVENLVKGVYMLNVYTDDQIRTVKIIKE